jgi:hypothetical protein
LTDATPSPAPALSIRRTFADARLAPGERIAAGIIGGCCLIVLLIAAGLSPSPAGEGTHTQLGLPPCGWVIRFGKPCPTCGMTTAFAHAAHMGLWEGFKTQPMGLLLALATAAGFWVCLHIVLTGSQLGRVCARMLSPLVLWVLAGMLLAAWAYKFATWPTGG